MTIFNWIEISFASFVMIILAYRGVLGMHLFAWTRIPFVFISEMCMGIALCGVPPMPVKVEEDEYNQEEIANIQAPDERGKVDDAHALFKWMVQGITPDDVRKRFSSPVQSNLTDEEEDDLNARLDRPESHESWKARRQLERVG